MVKPVFRRKSIGTKVSEEEYARLEMLAGGRAIYFDGAYAPFGEGYAETGTADLSFTGMNQDTVNNLYDFPDREYSIQGRWPSPDPAGITSVDPRNPQSWSRLEPYSFRTWSRERARIRCALARNRAAEADENNEKAPRSQTEHGAPSTHRRARRGEMGLCAAKMHGKLARIL